MLDNTNYIDNIYSTAKIKGIKIGDLETAAGVSKGYLSRISRGESKSSPTVEVLASMAEQLGVGIDFLINYAGHDVLSENEQFVMKFLDKISRKTLDGTLEWIPESAAYVNQNTEKKVNNPLVTSSVNYSYDFDTTYSVNVFQSMFYNGSTTLKGISYHTRLTGGLSELYFIYTSYDKSSPFDEGAEDVIEVYLYNDEVHPICSTEYVNPKVAKAIRDIYYCINNVLPKVGIDKSAKDAMTTFLNF